MTEFWSFVLLGLGLGGIYALAAQGVVLIYRGSGVLNFANGALIAVGAFVYARSAELGAPAGAALLLAVVVCGLLGAAIHLVVMRPLRLAAPMTRLVATLAVATVVQAALLGWPFHLGGVQPFVASYLPAEPVELTADLVVSSDRLWILAIATLLSVAGWAVYRWTRFGLVTRAVAENEEAAAALGRSPDVIATVNWFAGAGIAGLAGALVVPIVGLSVLQLTLLLVPTLAAALVGSFRSFPLTLLGGLLLGVTESVLTSNADWIPALLRGEGWSKSVAFLVIIVVLVVQGRALPLRGHVLDRVPAVGSGRIRPVAVAVAVGASVLLVTGIGVLGYGGLPLNWVNAVTTTAVAALVCLSVVVVVGYTGQFSLAQYALAGTGAYVAARAASGGELLGLFSVGTASFGAALLLGVAAAVPIGMLVGLPALRTRGANLAIATLGLALFLERVVFSNPDYTGGFEGTIVGSVTLLGIDLDPSRNPRGYAVMTILALVLAGLVVANLRRGRSGRRLLAVRTNERAAASLGISVVGAKLYGFAVASAIAALGGILLSFRSSAILFEEFTVGRSIEVVVQTVLGGVGFIGGAIFGGAISLGGIAAHAVTELFDIDAYLIILLTGLLSLNNLVRFRDGLSAPVGRGLAKLLDLVRLAVLRSERPPTVLPEPEPVSLYAATLEIDGLSVAFGGLIALHSVSFEVRPGEIVGLIGPNGAGKTTLIDAVSGFTRPQQGTVTLDGRSMDRWSARRRARAGVARSFQSLELFEDMTVLDNLRAASDRRDRWSYLLDLVWPRNRPLPGVAVAAVHEFGLADALEQTPGELPYGRRRLVGIARAVSTEPAVLLLDEPAAGLDEVETAELGTLLHRLADDWGLGVLLVEHDVNLVMSVCDRIVVLDFGELIAEGVPEEIRGSDTVREAYLGTSSDEGGSAHPDRPIVGSAP